MAVLTPDVPSYIFGCTKTGVHEVHHSFVSWRRAEDKRACVCVEERGWVRE